MIRDEDGYLVIEASITFTLFILLIVSILSLINISAAQARVHNALTQTANTLSVYSYILHRTKLDGILQKSANKAYEIESGAVDIKNQGEEIINDAKNSAKFDSLKNIMEKPNQFRGLVGKTKSLSDSVDSYQKAHFANPSDAVKSLATFGIDLAKGKLSAMAIEPLLRHYLSNDEINGDSYVKNLKFDLDLDDAGEASDIRLLDKAEIVDKDNNIVLIADYDIEYGFSILKLSHSKLHIHQEVSTKVWGGGAGPCYWIKE